MSIFVLLRRNWNFSRFSWVEPHWPISCVLQAGNWNFLIWIVLNMELVYKSCVMIFQTDFLISDKIKLKLFAQPFDFAVEDSPEDCQMELIELQADMNTKRKYSENSLVDFYKLNVCKKFPSLSCHAKRMASLFGSTYCCE